jgi:hypothetical protein
MALSAWNGVILAFEARWERGIRVLSRAVANSSDGEVFLSLLGVTIGRSV